CIRSGRAKVLQWTDRVEKFPQGSNQRTGRSVSLTVTTYDPPSLGGTRFRETRATFLFALIKPSTAGGSAGHRRDAAWRSILRPQAGSFPLPRGEPPRDPPRSGLHIPDRCADDRAT